MPLSGAGKTTIAGLLKEKLTDEDFFAIVLDGDTMRETINKYLGFSTEDRLENVPSDLNSPDAGIKQYSSHLPAHYSITHSPTNEAAS
ncbi:adenylyl-sulfate kinase [Mucilaginibacter ginsenosidivorax]|uniref:adenylyl-sulfate kinase n=1 Tax=Mucilaginibacter ginsenosidivorax TaxID=862126 RepID=UPI001CEF8296|nr:adenylyl-sulfate kinase [Mucilaginibacter ginsenosidivorax]